MARKGQAASQYQYYRVARDMMELGLRAGDTVSYSDSGREQPYMLVRTLDFDDDTFARATALGLIRNLTSEGEAPSAPAAPARYTQPGMALRLVK